MENNIFTSFHYLVGNDFIYQDKVEVKVFFIYKYQNIIKTIDVKKKAGANESYYINEAKKIINGMIKNGSLEKYVNELNIKRAKVKKVSLASILSLTGACAIAGVTYGIHVLTYVEPSEYRVEFYDDDRTTLLYGYNAAPHSWPTYEGEQPSKPRDKTYFYRFAGWDHEFSEVTSYQSYYAVYDKVKVDDVSAYIRIEIPEDAPSLKVAFAYHEIEGKTAEINWGDAQISNGESEHTYRASGAYDITFKGIYELGLASMYSPSDSNGCEYIKEIYLFEDITVIGRDYRLDFFNDCTSLKCVSIPKSVVMISGDEGGTFGNCPNLTSITIDKDNEYYDSRDNCNAIITKQDIYSQYGSLIYHKNTLLAGCNTTIIPDTVTTIDSGAFMGSNIIEVNIPNSVTSIGGYAFGGCVNLKSITISESVEFIGESIFYGCSNLSSIIVDEDNQYYDSRDNCNAIITKQDIVIEEEEEEEEVIIPKDTLLYGSNVSSIPNSVSYISSGAFSEREHLKTITIPNSVVSIGDEAFYGCSNLTSVTFDDSTLTTIGYSAFRGCSKLTSIVIPRYVSSIENWIFSDCSSLMSIEVDPQNETFNSANGANAIIETSSNTLVAGCGNSTIPNTVTEIGSDAFYECSALTSINIPEGVTTIGAAAFYECVNLPSINIPSTVTNIRTIAFNGCAKLSLVDLSAFTIPNVDKIPSLMSSVFEHCDENLKFKVANEGMIDIFTKSGKKNWPTDPTRYFYE